MKLINKKFLRDAVKLGDLLHTVNGGISQTLVETEQREHETIIHVSAPGVSPESFNVVVHKNRLVIVSELQHEANQALRVPLFSRTWDLPAFVNLSEIEAEYHQGGLQVRLPYHAGADKPRLIRIKHRD